MCAISKDRLNVHRAKAVQMRGVHKGVQAQAPSDRTQATTQRGKALPVLQVPQALLSLRLLQPTHESSFLLLQTV